MTTFNYNNRYFQLTQTSSGDSTAIGQTIFHYLQKDDTVWGTYEGGSVAFGTIVGKMYSSGDLDLRFQHMYVDGRMLSGKAYCHLEILPDGRYRLLEDYHFFDTDFHGQSTVEEIILDT